MGGGDRLGAGSGVSMQHVRRLSGMLASLALAATVVGMPPAADGASAAEDGLVSHRLRVMLPTGPREVTLAVAPGFEIGVAVSGLPNARMLAQSPTGELVLSQHVEGRVVKLADPDGDGVVDEVVPILTGLNMPHGLAFAGDVLFVAETDRILRLDVWWSGASARPIAELPGGGHHQTRSLALGPDGKLYVSIGSSCDACEEADPRRAAVWRLDQDGSNVEPFARGLRNAVGLAWSPDGQLWATENERNELGEETPPDELNLLEAGADYGWPACYGDGVPQPGLGTPERCAQTRAPALAFPAHAAPLGLAFYDGDGVRAEYRGDLFVALHGSALRHNPVGYEVVRIAMRDGRPVEQHPFTQGWLVGGDSWGRPVGPFVARDGTLYLTDDKGGLVYWIHPTNEAHGATHPVSEARRSAMSGQPVATSVTSRTRQVSRPSLEEIIR